MSGFGIVMKSADKLCYTLDSLTPAPGVRYESRPWLLEDGCSHSRPFIEAATLDSLHGFLAQRFISRILADIRDSCNEAGWLQFASQRSPNICRGRILSPCMKCANEGILSGFSKCLSQQY